MKKYRTALIIICFVFILLAVAINYFFDVQETITGEFIMCIGAQHPTEPCQQGEKRVAWMAGGCVKKLVCLDPSQVPGGVTAFRTCASVPILHQQQFCDNPAMPFKENVYRGSDYCQIGILCFASEYQAIPSTPSWQQPPEYTIPITGQQPSTPTIPVIGQPEPVPTIQVTGEPKPPVYTMPITEQPPIPTIQVTEPPKPSIITYKTRLISIPSEAPAHYISKIPDQISVTILPHGVGA